MIVTLLAIVTMITIACTCSVQAAMLYTSHAEVVVLGYVGICKV